MSEPGPASTTDSSSPKAPFAGLEKVTAVVVFGCMVLIFAQCVWIFVVILVKYGWAK